MINNDGTMVHREAWRGYVVEWRVTVGGTWIPSFVKLERR